MFTHGGHLTLLKGCASHYRTPRTPRTPRTTPLSLSTIAQPYLPCRVCVCLSYIRLLLKNIEYCVHATPPSKFQEVFKESWNRKPSLVRGWAKRRATGIGCRRNKWWPPAHERGFRDPIFKRCFHGFPSCFFVIFVFVFLQEFHSCSMVCHRHKWFLMLWIVLVGNWLACGTLLVSIGPLWLRSSGLGSLPWKLALLNNWHCWYNFTFVLASFLHKCSSVYAYNHIIFGWQNNCVLNVFGADCDRNSIQNESQEHPINLYIPH